MQNITLPDIQLPQYKLEMHTSNFNDLPKILKISLDRIFTRCISQFVDSWYCQANKSQNTEFQQCLRSCMEKSVCNLKNYINIADVPTLCTYAFTNALIIHLREFKKYIKTGILSTEYINHTTVPNMVSYLHNHAALLISRIFPKKEIDSICMNSLSKELLAANVLYPVLELISDPDFINQTIVNLLKPIDPLAHENSTLFKFKMIRIKNCLLKDIFCTIEVAERKIKSRNFTENELKDYLNFKIPDRILIQKQMPNCRIEFFSVSKGSIGNLEFTIKDSNTKQTLKLDTKYEVILETETRRCRTQNSSLKKMSVKQILENNDLFLLFFEYLNNLGAPPYLQFLMNIEAFKQISLLDSDSDDEVLKEKIGSEGVEIIKNHFTKDARLPIPMDPYLVQEIMEKLNYPLEINRKTFEKTQKWVIKTLEEKYFQGFINEAEAEVEFFGREQVNLPPKFKKGVSDSVIYNHQSSQSFPLKSKSCGSVSNNLDPIKFKKLESDKSLIIAISNLKEKIFLIEEKIETLTSKSEKKDLKKVRNSLKDQLNGLLEMVSKTGSIDKIVRKKFNFATVHVEFIPNQRQSIISLMNNNDPQFDVQIETITKVFVNVSKKFSEFQRFFKDLIKQFPKMSKVKFPSKKFGSNDKQIAKLSAELENILKVILMDEIIGQSEMVYQFLDIYNDLNDSSPSLRSNDSLSDISIYKSLEAIPNSAKTKEKKYQENTSDDKFFADLTDKEVDLILDTTFAFITEAFDLNDTSQWFRRKILGMVKQLVKQAYNEPLNNLITDFLNKNLSPPSLAFYIDLIVDSVWPNGANWTNETTIIRTEEQKLATKIEAKTLFLKNSPEILLKLVGNYNTVIGMNNIFNVLQHKEFNMKLSSVILDIFIKLLFSENKNKN